MNGNEDTNQLMCMCSNFKYNVCIDKNNYLLLYFIYETYLFINFKSRKKW